MTTRPRRGALGLPRYIKPESADTGDLIRVTYKATEGVTMTREGIVHHVESHGRVRFLMTEEGGNLLAWEPGEGTTARVTLLAVSDKAQPALFELENAGV